MPGTLYRPTGQGLDLLVFRLGSTSPWRRRESNPGLSSYSSGLLRAQLKFLWLSSLQELAKHLDVVHAPCGGTRPSLRRQVPGRMARTGTDAHAAVAAKERLVAAFIFSGQLLTWYQSCFHGTLLPIRPPKSKPVVPM